MLRAKKPPQGGFFMGEVNLLRTIVYVDGYNLYYSRLKGTPYKWLDIPALFRDRIVTPQNPASEVVKVKYFTSPVMASYARHGKASEEAQTQYLRALLARSAGFMEVIKGFHVFQPTHLPAYRVGASPNKDDLSSVWMIEEKQTDVNIALEVYRDSIQGSCDQIVVCSNDSDIETAFRCIRTDAPHVQIGLVMPLREVMGENLNRPNQRLVQHAHWVRHHIRDEELAACQLPQNVQTKKKPASKPAHW